MTAIERLDRADAVRRLVQRDAALFSERSRRPAPGRRTGSAGSGSPPRTDASCETPRSSRASCSRAA